MYVGDFPPFFSHWGRSFLWRLHSFGLFSRVGKCFSPFFSVSYKSFQSNMDVLLLGLILEAETTQIRTLDLSRPKQMRAKAGPGVWEVTMGLWKGRQEVSAAE